MEPSSATGSAGAVLVVDDEPVLVETIAYNLEREGFAVLKAGDGESALKLACEARPQLIILDVMLPALSGWDVCRALRADPNCPPDVPILMLTGLGEESDKAASFESGANDYLLKPFSMKELLARVRALLEQ